MKIIILTLFLATNLVAQDWYVQIGHQSSLISKITANEDWNSILDYAKNELELPSESLYDLTKTIEFQSSRNESNLINQFFFEICDSTYSEFPYRRSGHLTDNLYVIPNIDTSEIGQIILKMTGRSLYAKFAELINFDESELIPQLLGYLKNDAATRLCIRPIEWDESPFYLSISDVAMELLEVKTYCDFFDNASHSQKLFSNLSKIEKDEIIKKVEKWVKFKNGKTQFQKIEYFLDSLSDLGHSFRYTCHNLMFIGDTIGAKKMYAKFYKQTEMPCRQDFEIGGILLELGDRRVLNDCSDKIYNYKCTPDSWEGLGKNCVEIFFNSDEAWFRDDIFAEIIATEPHSNYRKDARKAFIWHYIFGMIPNTERKLLKTLVELMSFQDTLSSLNNRFTEGWKSNYPNEFESSYRVCDFALIKYIEAIEDITKLNYGNIDEKKKMIEILDKINIMNVESVDDRNKMIELIKKYED